MKYASNSKPGLAFQSFPACEGVPDLHLLAECRGPVDSEYAAVHCKGARADHDMVPADKHTPHLSNSAASQIVT